MAEASSLMSPRAVQIRAPPSLTSCIDIVNRATAPYHNEKLTRGAIISFDFKYHSNIFFVEKETRPKFDLNFMFQIEDEYHGPVELHSVVADHFNLNNNITELSNDRKKFPDFKTSFNDDGTISIRMRSPDDYCNWGNNNVRFVVLSNFYPSNINVSVSLSTIDGASQLQRAFIGASRPYMASSPNEEKLHKLLCWAAGLGYDILFKAYLYQIPLGLEMEDTFGMTPFSWAAQNGCASVVRLALQQAGSICARRRTARGPAPLEAAAHSQNEDIFMKFLKWLKYIETPIGTDTTLEPDEIPQRVPDLVDGDIEREIHSAIRNKQTFTTRKLVEILYNLQEVHSQKWLANRIIRAAEEGDLYLVQALRSCGAEVNCENDDGVTPLMGAIVNKETKVAEYLILQGAEDDITSSALRKAVDNGQHSTIRALLQVRPPLEEDLKQDLLDTAGGNRDSTTLMLLQLVKGTEKLATRKVLCTEVDKRFYATVVDFSENQTPQFTELSVNELMQAPQDFFDCKDKSNFKWFHLPANNMKWAEALISKIYHENPSLASKVLEPKRWIKRQHEGENGSWHARFMMPTCHDFQEAFNDKKKKACEEEDRHVVLFMPYLHWDDEATMQNRLKLLAKPISKDAASTEVLKESSSTTAKPSTNTGKKKDLSSTFKPISGEPLIAPQPDNGTKYVPPEEMLQREERLIEKYLLSEISHDKNSRHLLHVRRTLDQSLYHNLKDTKIRDADQTVRRYQKMLHPGKKADEVPFAVIMVDQLWLWILLGPSGKAQAVVTCFPSRDWPDDNKGSSSKIHALDPQRTTDVLQTTKSYIQQRPDAVKTPYDLAGVIASRCSRALLDHSTDMLDFTEAYESSINYIMNEEVLLFNTFNHLMQTRTKAMQGLQKARELSDEDDPREADSCLANDIVEEIKTLNLAQEGTGDPRETKGSPESKRAEELKKTEESKKRLQKYRDYTMDTEIPDEDDIEGQKKAQEERPGKESETEEVQRLTTLFEKFGRFFVLDITREISLLRQIKDIQDEFEMIDKIFTDQKEVIEALDRIIRSMIRSNDPHDEKQVEDLSPEPNLRRSDSHFISVGDGSESTYGFLKEHKRSNTVESYITDDLDSAFADEHLFAYEQHGYLDKETQKRKDSMKQAQSIIWQFRHQKQNLPIRTVNRFAEQIRRMNERAKNTNVALNTLVDLKQKQNNMIDTRTARLQADQARLQAEQARLQAEQTHTMAMESERQGRTLMVFTVVTIIFLPLSFIAAFFAIPVKEFTSGMTLDFVSMITFPVSAATSLLIIVVGFAASEWDWIREYLMPKIPTWLRKDVKPTDGGQSALNQNETRAQDSQGVPDPSPGTTQKPNDSMA